MIRTKKGELIKFNDKHLSNDKEYYIKLWKIKYNITLTKNSIKTKILNSLKNIEKNKIKVNSNGN
tara:strand:- start:1296 stop:1490 length:195 start_codon:yes stop_codon:yes gene_type:complete